MKQTEIIRRLSRIEELIVIAKQAAQDQNVDKTACTLIHIYAVSERLFEQLHDDEEIEV